MEKIAFSNKFCVLFSSYRVLCLFSLTPNGLIPWGTKEDTQNLFLRTAFLSFSDADIKQASEMCGSNSPGKVGWSAPSCWRAQSSPVLFNKSLPSSEGRYPAPRLGASLAHPGQCPQREERAAGAEGNTTQGTAKR